MNDGEGRGLPNYPLHGGTSSTRHRWFATYCDKKLSLAYGHYTDDDDKVTCPGCLAAMRRGRNA